MPIVVIRLYVSRDSSIGPDKSYNITTHRLWDGLGIVNGSLVAFFNSQFEFKTITAPDGGSYIKSRMLYILAVQPVHDGLICVNDIQCDKAFNE